MNKPLILFLFVFFFFGKLFSQSNLQNDPSLFTNTHYYTFKGDGNCNKEHINKLQSELKQIEFVKDVTIRYSDEKKSGSIKVITQEKPIVEEGQRSFSPAVLKNELIKFNLSPINYTSELGAK
ncbi:MAG: hypothetical protein V4565_14375 [Bacteroidota bacterium]